MSNQLQWGRNAVVRQPSDSPNGPSSSSTTPRSDTPTSQPSFIEIVENSILFYAETDRDKVLQLVKSIRQMNIELTNKQSSLGLVEPIPIRLYIHSYGGYIFSAMSVVDEILKSKLPVISIVDGCAASAATLFSVCAHKRLIMAHSHMLIHQLTSGMWGKMSELEDEMENCKRIMDMVEKIYLTYTKIPKKILKEILKHDLWFDAETCLKYGLVDDIL